MKRPTTLLSDREYEIPTGVATIRGTTWVMRFAINETVGRAFDHPTLTRWARVGCPYLPDLPGKAKLRLGFVFGKARGKSRDYLCLYHVGDLKKAADGMSAVLDPAIWLSAYEAPGAIPGANTKRLYKWKVFCPALGRPIATKLIRKQAAKGTRLVLCFLRDDIVKAIGASNPFVGGAYVSQDDAIQQFGVTKSWLNYARKRKVGSTSEGQCTALGHPLAVTRQRVLKQGQRREMPFYLRAELEAVARANSRAKGRPANERFQDEAGAWLYIREVSDATGLTREALHTLLHASDSPRFHRKDLLHISDFRPRAKKAPSRRAGGPRQLWVIHEESVAEICRRLGRPFESRNGERSTSREINSADQLAVESLVDKAVAKLNLRKSRIGKKPGQKTKCKGAAEAWYGGIKKGINPMDRFVNWNAKYPHAQFSSVERFEDTAKKQRTRRRKKDVR